jgi:hypothetical protein
MSKPTPAKPARPETQRVERSRIDETLAPLRNFTISTADRVRAAAGPPAFSRRKRHIEDLEVRLRQLVSEALAAAEEAEGAEEAEEAEEAKEAKELQRTEPAPSAAPGHRRARLEAEAACRCVEADPRVMKCLRELNRLVDAHNRYYPIEANLPLDPATRLQLDHGKPWQPMPAIALADVIAACGLAGHVGKMT